MYPDELDEWMIDLQENGTALSSEDLQKVARTLIMRGHERHNRYHLC